MQKPALVWCYILSLLVNTMTADNKCSRCNMQNFEQKFQAPLSKKENNFSEFFIEFLKYAWNLKEFEKKDEYPSVIISQIIDCERGCYLNI